MNKVIFKNNLIIFLLFIGVQKCDDFHLCRLDSFFLIYSPFGSFAPSIKVTRSYKDSTKYFKDIERTYIKFNIEGYVVYLRPSFVHQSIYYIKCENKNCILESSVNYLRTLFNKILDKKECYLKKYFSSLGLLKIPIRPSL